MQVRLASVEVSYLLHETEDAGKVDEAVGVFLGVPGPFEKETLEGHFGNRILRAELRFTGKEAGDVAAKVMGSLPVRVGEEVVSSIASMVDEHSAFYLRIDKQKLVSGAIEIGSGDVVRVRIKPRWLPRGDAEGFYIGLLGRA